MEVRNLENLYFRDSYKNWANQEVGKWVQKGIGLNTPASMEIYLLWLKNPKWICKI